MKYNDNGLWKTLNVKVTDTLPVGTIIPYAGTTIPSNYMKCEGQELSRIEYDILFSAIGTTYGVGDGTTTFNLPNLKGRVITGIDSNDTDFDVLGETGGEKTHTLTVGEMPSHNHTLTLHLDGTQALSGQHGVYGTNGRNNEVIENTGGGQPHNNLQPYIVLNYIIKVLDAPATGVRSETLPVGTVIDYEGDTIPVGWEEVNNPDSYSTSEVKTNKVWIDGKPIYRKVFTGNVSSSIEHGLTNVNFVNSYGYMTSGGGAFVPLPSVRPANAGFYIGYYVTNQYIVFDKAADANGVATITLEYTKTTD